ncbi:cysteine--tRNA ligase [Fusibacter paucivorans]|uniref:Cysteine--tRNA ligase n=1 Tax=Fusibacter paucivorans TaxID=76009 RepID=A0ABS5PT65_9FIRM|nr:cysteine--tRNA ligase [Fusibacter paucivorans]MBS7528360.1 cysteine--tRNA ligase [Fusibacter paucivorans]
MKIYNSLTRQKEIFKTVEPGKVKMYVCGPTVYNYFHIGNARPFLVFDAFRHYLMFRGYEVTFVQNFTDVDDKIIKKANEEHVHSTAISEKYIDAYFEDADRLGITRADYHPKVTETIPAIIDFVQTLINKGNAYEIDGNVYFAVDSFSQYGQLSKQAIDDLEAGARIDISEEKRNPLDFALWKKAKPGEPSWESPWGEGRPGWHIECSVMSTTILGETIDIHAGGQDLIFPHHENEIAQSEAKTGKTYVNYWMHNGYINIDNQKMSKSLNNFFTTREILDEFEPEVVRFFMLQAHYRSPINFSRELMEAASNGLERLYNVKENLLFSIAHAQPSVQTVEENEMLKTISGYKERFIEVMDDDFNTADGIAVIFEMAREINIDVTPGRSKAFLEAVLDSFLELTEVLGILKRENKSLDTEIEMLIAERQQARKDKDFKRADEIRDQLKADGIVLEDTPQGVKWHRKG